MSGVKTPSPNKKTGKDESPKAKSPSSKISRSRNNAIVKKEENYLARCTNYRLTTGYEVTICNCKHIRKIRIGERHSICNPQRWLCDTCFTTDSVWACLSCPNVACGRYIKEHALTHFQESGHPLAIDVNELYVFCYKCDDYVLNDNNSSDIKVLRETLLAIRYQNFTGTTRSGHTLRSAMITEQEDLEMRRQMQQEQLDRDDRLFTAIWHSRFVRQRKAFRQWIRYIKWKRNQDVFLESDDDEIEDEEITELTAENESNSTAASPALNLHLSTDTVTKDTDIDSLLKLPESPKCPELPGISMPLDIPVSPKLNKTATDASEQLDQPNMQSTVEEVVPSPSKSAQSPSHENSNIESGEKKMITVCLKDLSVNIMDLSKPSASENVQKSEKQDSASENVTHAIDHCELGGEVIPEGSPDIKQEDQTDKEDVCEQEKDTPVVPLNILSRPKRVNAAGRYKEIFNSLVGVMPRTTSSPVSSRRISAEPPAKKRALSTPTPAGRRSDRIKKIERQKEIAAKRKQPRAKSASRLTCRKRPRENRLNSNKTKTKSRSSGLKSIPKKKSRKMYGSRSCRTRRLIGGPTIEGRRMNTIRPPSLYDNIPNKAVTSLIPGVTGLRNLGNTCYLNSIIQVLGHLQKFRLCLLALRELEFRDSILGTAKGMDDAFAFATPQGKPVKSLTRRSTVELYNEQIKPKPLPTRTSERMKSGLNGGQSPDGIVGDSLALSPSKATHRSPTTSGSDSWSSSLSLCNELDHLYQVMWSGKWKLVSPYHFLHSVWSLIPSFRGYTQQDAQEFLCELLDKIVSELKRSYSDCKAENNIAQRILKVVKTVFEGSLMSRVRCLECGNVSSTVEPFWDLSLEFPERYHKISSKRKSSSGARPTTTSSDPCTLHEMLKNFTAPETLEGGRVYGCNKCNFLQQNKGCTQKKKPPYRKNSQFLTEAEKQLKVRELPQVLRFHLKRFRWIGRNHREKISVHVDFPSELDMKHYCWVSEKETMSEKQYMYDLSAVVMHHGRGFGSGHYTANCWNDSGEFWVHCNDSNLELCSIEDVMASQAYILFYTLRGLDPQPHILSPPLTPTVPSPSSLSPKPSECEVNSGDFEATDLSPT